MREAIFSREPLLDSQQPENGIRDVWFWASV